MKADFEQLTAAQRGMADAITELDQLRDKVAMARQIVEFCGDRRKSALSVLVVEFLDREMTSSAAEHRARADERFKESMRQIMKQTALLLPSRPR